MRSAYGLVVTSILASCTPVAKQYTLKVDLADQSNTQLCHRETNKEATKVGNKLEKVLPEEDCEAFGAQALSTPGTLTIKLQHPTQAVQYDIRVSQFSREANASDAKRILSNVIQRAMEVAQLLDLAGGTRGKQIVVEAAQSAADKAPEVAEAIVGKLGAPAAPLIERAPPKDVFGKPYFDGKKLATAAEARGKVVGITNAPPRSPPPRSYKLGDADLKFLLEAGVTADQLGDFVIEWCTADSFKSASDKDRYDALATTPQPDDVRDTLAIEGKDIAAMLLARSTKDLLADRINKLIVESNKWDTASAAAKTFATMRLGTTLMSDLAHCEENVAFLETKVSDAERTKLAAVVVADAFVKLRANAQKYAQAFDATFAPLFQDAIEETEKFVKVAGTDMATTITLDPGRLELGVGETDAAGKRTEVVTYKVQTRGVERLAILLGPALTYCTWGCFDRVDQVAVQPENMGDPVYSELQKTKHTHDFSLATALHVTFWRFAIDSADFGLGGVFGYPIGSAKGTSSNFLVGLGLRHSSGIELSIGLHAFASRVLKSSYPERIDLREPGNQGLTIDSVTEDAAQWAGFLMIGFAPDVFSAIKE